MHADQLSTVAKRHDGHVPPTWLTGDTEYQKAAVIAAVAWEDIRDPADPQFIRCDLTFRESCIGVVESLMRGNEPDTTPFAQAAAKRWAEVNNPPVDQLAHHTES